MKRCNYFSLYSLRRGFTLIEILLVVAILLVLAAMAVPNSLKAITRAKVSRSLAEMKTIANALEAFNVDNARYPHPRLHAFYSGLAGDHGAPLDNIVGGPTLTGPISYISRLPFDPFDNAGKPAANLTFNPANDANYCIGRYDYNSSLEGYILASNGPAGLPTPQVVIGTVPSKRLNIGDPITVSEVAWTRYFDDPNSVYHCRREYFHFDPGIHFVYDPTNGSASPGGLFIVGP